MVEPRPDLPIESWSISMRIAVDQHRDISDWETTIWDSCINRREVYTETIRLSDYGRAIAYSESQSTAATEHCPALIDIHSNHIHERYASDTCALDSTMRCRKQVINYAILVR